MKGLDNLIGNEVFVVGTDEMSGAGGISIFESLFDLIDSLKGYDVANGFTQLVLHGVLGPGAFVPKDLRGKKPYVIVLAREDSDKLRGSIIESDSDTGSLEADIGNAIKEGVGWASETGSIYPEMEDVYVLYGDELTLVPSVDEDDLDEETIETAKEIVQEALDEEAQAMRFGRKKERRKQMEYATGTKIQLTIIKKGGVSHKVSGRLLGLCNDQELAFVAKTREESRKTMTRGTMPLTTIGENFSLLNDLRLLSVIDSVGGIDTRPTLLATSQLSMVNHWDPLAKELIASSENGDMFCFKEVDKKSSTEIT